MPRPFIRRRVFRTPLYEIFKPRGVPLRELEQVVLTIDELEALRLAHIEGFYHVAIARHMGVSRPTAGRILESAHRKLTTALVEGKALRIEGGTYDRIDTEPERCPRCGEQRRRRWRKGRWRCDDCGGEADS